METIYNHNITSNELKLLDKMTPGRVINNQSNYESSYSSDIFYADLYRLYNMRGNIALADFYFNKIQDQMLKYLLKDF